MLYVYKTLIDTPESRSLGIGDVSDERMAAAAATIAESFELPRVPKPPTCSAVTSCRPRPIGCRRCCPIDRNERARIIGLRVFACRAGANA